MNDEAAHLVDGVIPEVPVRQWVLSFPFKMRYKMACDPSFMSKALKIYAQEIQVFQKQRAKFRGLTNIHCGAVTFIQRFGSALNLNIHFHTLVPDGVFYKVKEEYHFYWLSKPSVEELSKIARKIKNKVERYMIKKGLTEDLQMGFDEESIEDLHGLSISQKAGFGDRAGRGLRRFGVRSLENPEGYDSFSANIEGFSLNASVGVPAKDRKRLEQLIRYMARGPLAIERLSEVFPNQLIYKMKSPWRDGTTHVSFAYLDFIARLVALIPPPMMNMVRYHGCFAPNFKDRKLIIKKQKAKRSPSSSNSAAPSLYLERVKRERLKWAEMLKRTFKIDVTICPKCSGRMEQIAVIKDKSTAKKILESIGELSLFRPLKVVKDRGPPKAAKVFDDEFDQRYSTW